MNNEVVNMTIRVGFCALNACSPFQRKPLIDTMDANPVSTGECNYECHGAVSNPQLFRRSPDLGVEGRGDRLAAFMSRPQVIGKSATEVVSATLGTALLQRNLRRMSGLRVFRRAEVTNDCPVDQRGL